MGQNCDYDLFEILFSFQNLKNMDIRYFTFLEGLQTIIASTRALQSSITIFMGKEILIM